MTPERMILLIIDKDGGLIRGKTLLQKRAYFLSTLLKKDLGYHPHYYGPYSPIVQSTLNKLRATGFIEERVQGFDISSQLPFEPRRYDYALTGDGNKVVSTLKSNYKEETNQIFKALDKLRDAGDTGDYVSLSIAAKTHHILTTEKGKMKKSEFQRIAKELGWKISDPQIESAVEFLKNLRQTND